MVRAPCLSKACNSQVVTLAAGFFAYRVAKDRDGAPDPVDALVRPKK
jgi:hypothetical protein